MINYENLEKINKKIIKIDVKGKPYAMVNERVKAFRELCPKGTISSEIIKLEDGVCVIKASVFDDEGKLLATGYAYEKENSTFINKTSYVENCVPLDTQILTQEGWKYYFQLKENELVYSYDLDKEKYVWANLEKVNVYDNKPITEIYTSRFRVKCTLQHKWVVTNQEGKVYKRETENLKKSDRIIQSVPQDIKSSEIGKKLGWLICDCDVTKTKNGLLSTAYIRQSKKQHIKDIKDLFGDPSKRKKYKLHWLDSYEWIIGADEVRKIFGHYGMADYKDLEKAMLKAPIEDVKGCFESMMRADGSRGSFSSTYIELINAMQTMCARLGIATTFITSRKCELATKPIYTLGIKKTTQTYCSELNFNNLPPQKVWCPTTETGTWVMKQGDFVTLTSNCDTSAIGRALGFAGIGIDESIASYEEVANAITNQNKKTEKQKTPTFRNQFILFAKEHSLDFEELSVKYDLNKKSTELDFRKALELEAEELGKIDEKKTKKQQTFDDIVKLAEGL